MFERNGLKWNEDFVHSVIWKRNHETLKSYPASVGPNRSLGHQITSWGGYHAGKITCGERKIGIHFQTSDALVFFIPGPDITVAEKEAYCDSLSKKNLRYTIRRWDDFILHLKAGSWKTMPTAAAEHLLKIDLQQEEIPSPWL